MRRGDGTLLVVLLQPPALFRGVHWWTKCTARTCWHVSSNCFTAAGGVIELFAQRDTPPPVLAAPTRGVLQVAAVTAAEAVCPLPA